MRQITSWDHLGNRAKLNLKWTNCFFNLELCEAFGTCDRSCFDLGFESGTQISKINILDKLRRFCPGIINNWPSLLVFQSPRHEWKTLVGLLRNTLKKKFNSRVQCLSSTGDNWFFKLTYVPKKVSLL